MVLKIGNKDYTIEFNIEASLNQECVEVITNFMCTIPSAGTTPLQSIVDAVRDKPKTALAMFYAGLLENHGTCDGADGSVTSMADAKKLIKQYFAEHKEDGTGNYYSLYALLIGQMEEDGFFGLIGLEQTITELSNLVENMMQQQQTKPKKVK